MLNFAIGSFIAAILVIAASGLTQVWLLGEMTDQVNIKRGADQQLDLFILSWRRATWYQVLREYRALYPDGKLHRLHTIAISAMLLSAIGCLVLLFGVFPTFSLPSR